MKNKIIEDCKKKRTFTTKRGAKIFAKKANKSLGNGKGALAPYLCQVCGNFHLTKRVNKNKNDGHIKPIFNRESFWRWVEYD